MKHDLAALPVDEFAQITVDIQAATRTILGALPEIRALREELATIPKFDLAAFDKLEDYVQALRFAQSGYQIAVQPADDLDMLAEEGSRLKERLLADVNALAVYGLFDSKKLDQLKNGQGFNNLAIDLEILSRAMAADWDKIQARALTSRADVDAASRVSLRLTRLVGLREQAPARLAAATELRTRAFTVLFRTYEEARAAITYVRRRQGDADSIAPSLFAGRTSKRVKDVGEPATEGGNAGNPAASSTPPASSGAVTSAAGAVARPPLPGGPFAS